MFMNCDNSPFRASAYGLWVHRLYGTCFQPLTQIDMVRWSWVGRLPGGIGWVVTWLVIFVQKMMTDSGWKQNQRPAQSPHLWHVCDYWLGEFVLSWVVLRIIDQTFLATIQNDTFSRRCWVALRRNTAGLTMDCRVGLRWHLHCGCPISKPRSVLGFSSKKSRVVYFFEKSKNEIVRPKMVFLVILAKIRSFSDNSDIIANSHLTSI